MFISTFLRLNSIESVENLVIGTSLFGLDYTFFDQDPEITYEKNNNEVASKEIRKIYQSELVYEDNF